MRTSTKIVALMAANSNAFFTQMFSHEAAVETPQTTKFSESLYSAQDWVEENWDEGTQHPVDYDGSLTSTVEGVYGATIYGTVYYDISGVEWSLDRVYAIGLYSYYDAHFDGETSVTRYGGAGKGVGALGTIYAMDYDYWYLGAYGTQEGALEIGYNGDYYFLIGTESGEVYYLSYHGEGWLSAGSDGYAIYGTGDYDTLDDLYNYGYEATDYMLSLLYLAAVYGYGSEDGYSWDYSGEYSLSYQGYDFSGPYTVTGELWYFSYNTWEVMHWTNVGTGHLYAQEGSAVAAMEAYSYDSGVWAYSWYYDWEIYVTEWVDTSYGGYYDGDDFTVMSASNGGYLASGTYAESNLTGAEWTASIDYASSDMEVTEELEEWATDLLLYYYSM